MIRAVATTPCDDQKPGASGPRRKVSVSRQPHHAENGGLILSASRNPGAPLADLGIAFNIASDGPAPGPVTQAIFAGTKAIDSYRMAAGPGIDLDRLGQGAVVIQASDDVARHDPVEGSNSRGRGVRIRFADGARVLCRLSGAGTARTTPRVCIERDEADPARFDLGSRDTRLDPFAPARRLARIAAHTGRDAPDVAT